jgi:hypothetical protein
LIQHIIPCHFKKKSAKKTLGAGVGAAMGTGGQHYTNMLLVHHQQMQVVTKDNGIDTEGSVGLQGVVTKDKSNLIYLTEPPN